MPKKRRRRRGGYKRGTHSSPKAGDCKYRSGWELSVMQYLDADDLVATYSYEKVVIPYVSNVRTGKLRKYYPDFLIEYVDGKKVLAEVKPSKKVTHATVVKKLNAARAWCLDKGIALEVITEHELKSLGLLP